MQFRFTHQPGHDVLRRRFGRATAATAVLVTAGALAISPTASAATAIAVPGTATAAHAKSATTQAVSPAVTNGLSPFATVTGKVYMSEDAIGTNDPAGGPVRVQKNDSSAKVQSAYLLAAATPFYSIVDGDITLNGTSLSFPPANNVTSTAAGSINSVWTDVTSIVKPIVDAAPAGNVAFTAAEPNNTGSIDGEILAVIMNDPTLPTDNTVSFQFGALNPAGDTYSIGLASPLNLSDPNLALTMSIGDSFGYQGPPASGQFSVISVNGTQITSSAGGNDDAVTKNDATPDFANAGNGELITVGGIGDSSANPPDPTATDADCAGGPPRCDDELYNLLPFVHNGDTSITVNTNNPSNDDNIFFTGFQLNSTAAVVGEGAILTPVSGTNPVNTPYTFTTKVQDSNGAPVANQAVSFKVLSGPNTGLTIVATTNAAGVATFSYVSTSTGTDTAQVSFTDAAARPVVSNQAAVTWTATTSPTPTTLTTSLSGAAQTGANITVPVGTVVTDSATLGGTNAASAGGTVGYKLFSDSTCTTQVSAAGGGTVVSGAVPSSSPQTLSTAGTYYWTASYSGDSTNQPSASACGSETVTVTPVTSTNTAQGSGTVGPVSGGKVTSFTFNVSKTGRAVSGSVSVVSPKGTFTSAAISAFTVSGHVAKFTATGTWKGLPGYTLTVTATDGSPDKVTLVVKKGNTKVFSVSGNLKSGTITVT